MFSDNGIVTTKAIMGNLRQRADIKKFLPAVASSDRSEVVAVASRRYVDDPVPAARFYHGEEAYISLLNDEAVKCVYIPLPNSYHYQWTVFLIRESR